MWKFIKKIGTGVVAGTVFVVFMPVIGMLYRMRTPLLYSKRNCYFMFGFGFICGFTGSAPPVATPEEIDMDNKRREEYNKSYKRRLYYSRHVYPERERIQRQPYYEFN